MNIMRQIAILFLICILGQGLSHFLPIPIPGSVIGMLLLLGLLLMKWVKIKHVETVGHFLLKNMAFFFIPAGVSVMENYAALQGKIIVLLLICIMTTIITFGATGIAVKMVIGLQEKTRGKENADNI
ncbi:MAG: CidA/LrgA family protein [Cellulosilyticaceae bacterium]